MNGDKRSYETIERPYRRYMDLWRICWHGMPNHLQTPDILISGVVSVHFKFDVYNFLNNFSSFSLSKYQFGKVQP
ncbi:hypothetical protein B9Z55_028878 [Caenorhabditis nigoni]|uniref:Uncharacterized protein n=1 Tax=Caenorhabditis nigoni TaxID=1611254 RepID=A0A2G5S9J9_9PELO|nr:hypothetical protein B9Z55_028878 [Caenorhabditis nigoni]